MPDPTTFGSLPGAAAAAGEFLGVVIVRPRPGVAVLDVAGEVDTFTAPVLEAALTDLLDGAEATLVVDLTGVRFLSSSGLAVLIRAADRSPGNGRRLRLVAATRAVRRPMEITGADQLFDMYTDVDAAAGATD